MRAKKIYLFRIPSKNHWNFHASIGSIIINTAIRILFISNYCKSKKKNKKK